MEALRITTKGVVGIFRANQIFESACSGCVLRPQSQHGWGKMAQPLCRKLRFLLRLPDRIGVRIGWRTEPASQRHFLASIKLHALDALKLPVQLSI
jgi:hypothetical protein